MRLVDEPGHVEDLTEDQRRGDRADPVDLGDARLGGGHQLLDLRPDGLDLLVDGDQLSVHVDSYRLTHPTDLVAGPDRGQQGLGPGCGQTPFRPTGQQDQQLTLEPADDLGPGQTSSARRCASSRSVAARSSGTTSASRGACSPTNAIDSASVSSDLRPFPPAKTRTSAVAGRHVQHPLTGGHQALRQRLPDPVAALDRPRPRLEPAGEDPELAQASSGRRERAPIQDLTAGINNNDGVDPLMRIHSDHDRLADSPHPNAPFRRRTRTRGKGSATSGVAVLSSRIPARRLPVASHSRATAITHWAAGSRATARHLTRASRRPGHARKSQVASSCAIGKLSPRPGARPGPGPRRALTRGPRRPGARGLRPREPPALPAGLLGLPCAPDVRQDQSTAAISQVSGPHRSHARSSTTTSRNWTRQASRSCSAASGGEEGDRADGQASTGYSLSRISGHA